MDTEIYKALSDESRLRIINILIERPLCVCEIEKILDISQSNVSRHLNKLRNSGMVVSRKDSQWVIYEIDSKFSENNINLYNHLKESFRKDTLLIEDKNKLENLGTEYRICKSV